jgi:alkanesulfonate monooxygenase SsuD/methylene tetrahydromethanopterin reductase-like flavin-dependent oxidoreductase (luciferase family)
MAAIVPPGEAIWGIQLPIQSQSTAFVADWEQDAGPDELALVAKAADAAGAGYVAVCDHVAIPEPLAPSMGATWYDTVATLGWLAGLTQQVRLLSHVWVLPYRHPAQTAKAFATLDRLSGGRAILGVGAGHVEGEFELLGADWAGRGRAVEEAIPAVRAALETGSVDGYRVAPGPVRAGGPPIWVGGTSRPAMRRAARLGDGWLPQTIPEGGMRAAIEWVLAEREAHLGAQVPFDMGIHAGVFRLTDHEAHGPYTVTDHERAAAQLAGCRRIGGNQLQVRFEARSASDLAEQLEVFGSQIWPAAS